MWFGAVDCYLPVVVIDCVGWSLLFLLFVCSCCSCCLFVVVVYLLIVTCRLLLLIVGWLLKPPIEIGSKQPQQISVIGLTKCPLQVTLAFAEKFALLMGLILALQSMSNSVKFVDQLIYLVVKPNSDNAGSCLPRSSLYRF